MSTCGVGGKSSLDIALLLFGVWALNRGDSFGKILGGLVLILSVVVGLFMGGILGLVTLLVACTLVVDILIVILSLGFHVAVNLISSGYVGQVVVLVVVFGVQFMCGSCVSELGGFILDIFLTVLILVGVLLVALKLFLKDS